MINKFLSTAVYAFVWLCCVVVQTLLLSAQGDTQSVWVAPQYYYSTWVVDLYLILLFYANYYGFAPNMIRRRLFAPYSWLTLGAALVGFLIPLLLFSTKRWTMPGTTPDTIPFSSLGVVGAVAVMAIGLALRAIREWVRLDTEVKYLRKELADRPAPTMENDQNESKPKLQESSITGADTLSPKEESSDQLS